jgi:hypothetical protein
VKYVGRSFHLQVVDLEISARQQRLSPITDEQRYDIALLWEPRPLPSLFAILKFDFKVTGGTAELIHVVDRQYHL